MRKLPGIGDYTSAAISAIAFNRKVAAGWQCRKGGDAVRADRYACTSSQTAGSCNRGGNDPCGQAWRLCSAIHIW
ncbi:MAG: hypothetical protein R3D29_11645 [Nitratireductor sp.]